MEVAIRLDAAAWGRFASAEARRILDAFGLPRDGGLEALERAIALRMYALVNEQHCEWSSDRSMLRFVMDVCRVQETRRRKGLADFPCSSVGSSMFSSFARAVDPRDPVPDAVHCPPTAAVRKILCLGVHPRGMTMRRSHPDRPPNGALAEALFALSELEAPASGESPC